MTTERTYGGLTAAELRCIVEKYHPITNVSDPRATLGALLDEVDRLRGALRAYGDHWPSCPAYTVAGACDCGWSALLKEGGK